jgi:aminopeptidase S
VNTDRALAHLQSLQKIADENGGNRASDNRGYEASVDYAVGVLRAANLDVTTPTYELSADDREDGGGAARPRNVIAQTRGGDPRHVVMLGAHLDSVPEGPGIVDDGSGVASVLEIATRLAAAPAGGNTVRFALFGSEETGAQGSESYIKVLSADERKKIMLYLNIDMVASPNAGYLVQGGTGKDEEETGPRGSAEVAQVLIDNLTKTGVTPERIPFVGDDESAFVEAGIPSAGAENGDAKKKTAEQAKAWGGQASEVYDRCYHQACDRLDNVNRVVLDHYLRALADTVAHYAASPNTLSR